MAEFLKRSTPQAGSKVPGAKPAKCKLMTGYPALTEFLTCDVWDESAVRTTGTVLVCYDGDRWKLWLNDRDQGLSAWISGDTLTDLLDSAEDGMRSGTIEWRKVAGAGKGKGRKN